MGDTGGEINEFPYKLDPKLDIPLLWFRSFCLGEDGGVAKRYKLISDEWLTFWIEMLLSSSSKMIVSIVSSAFLAS